MKKAIITEISGLSQYLPCLATIVTCHYNGRYNALAAAWHMSINVNPPLYGVSIALARFSHDIITKSREFAINFMPFNSAKLVAATGGVSGKDNDKFSTFNLKSETGVVTGVPVLSDAYSAFECILEDEHTYSDHTLFVGRVVAIHQADEAYSKDGLLDIESTKPCLYLGKERYIEINSYNLKHLSRKATASRLSGID